MEKINRREFLTRTAALAFAGTSTLGFLEGCGKSEREKSAENAKKVIKWLMTIPDVWVHKKDNEVTFRTTVFNYREKFMLVGIIEQSNQSKRISSLEIIKAPDLTKEGDTGFHIIDNAADGLKKGTTDCFFDMITRDGNFCYSPRIYDRRIGELNREYNQILTQIIQSNKIDEALQ